MDPSHLFHTVIISKNAKKVKKEREKYENKFSGSAMQSKISHNSHRKETFAQAKAVIER